jgi:RNA polymerase sigma-70 factor (ECF subfamily)
VTASNERPSFEQLYVVHTPLVRRVLLHRGVRSSDVDDVAQETFTTAHRLWPEFEGRSKIETWLCAIAWRLASNYRRRFRREQLEPTTPTSDDAYGEAISASDLNEALHRIDEEERDAFLLHCIGGLSISAVAELTGHARATIRHRIERARSKLTRDARALGARSSRIDALQGTAARAYALDHDESEPCFVTSCGGLCLSILDDIVLVVWRGQVSIEALEAANQVMRDLLAVRPDGIRYLSIVERTSTGPTREGRELQGWMIRELGPKLRAVAGVIDDSVLMQLAASVLNSYAFFVRTPLNLRYFTSITPALAWLGQYGLAEPNSILARVSAMRAKLDAAAR